LIFGTFIKFPAFGEIMGPVTTQGLMMIVIFIGRHILARLTAVIFNQLMTLVDNLGLTQ
jgi:hypothetical protein